MKNVIEIQVRAFPVVIQDGRTGAVSNDLIVLDKAQLQAAQMVRQSSKELIYRLYNSQGYRVLQIGKPERRTLSVNLTNLYQIQEA